MAMPCNQVACCSPQGDKPGLTVEEVCTVHLHYLLHEPPCSNSCGRRPSRESCSIRHAMTHNGCAAKRDKGQPVQHAAHQSSWVTEQLSTLQTNTPCCLV